MIYLDPTETSSSTRLPQAVINQAKVLPGLESATGADILVTTHEIKPLRGFQCSQDAIELIAATENEPGELAEMLDIMLPDVLAVRSAAEAIHNGILAQRKSGNDFLSSIPDLRDIRNRMLRWTWRSWLLVTGEFDVRNGHVVVDDRESGLTPECVHGAIRAWRLDGGQVDVLDSDDEIPGWINEVLNGLRVMESKADDDGRVRRYRRQIPDRDDDRARALAILATLKHVGENGARKLLDYYETLAGALEACLDPSIPKSKYRPGGVLGEATVQANRELFGLEDFLRFAVIQIAEGE